MKRLSAILILSLAMAVLAVGCKKKPDQVDLTSTHTTSAKETMAPATTKAQITTAPATEVSSSDAAKESTSDVQRVSSSIHKYKSGNLSIEYPVISGLSSTGLQETVNKKLLDNAVSIATAYTMDGDKDSLTVTCKVITADRRKVTATYTGLYTPDGAAYPTNLFYSNTVNTAHGTDVGLNDYADPYTLAGYILSGDCQFYQVQPEQKQALMEEKNGRTLEEYTDLFRHGDFPYKEPSTGASSEEIKFPQVFSYEEQGTIYVSIPVPHALGDYALIQYAPESK